MTDVMATNSSIRATFLEVELRLVARVYCAISIGSHWFLVSSSLACLTQSEMPTESIQG